MVGEANATKDKLDNGISVDGASKCLTYQPSLLHVVHSCRVIVVFRLPRVSGPWLRSDVNTM